MNRSAGLWLGVAGIGCLLFAAKCTQTGPGSDTGNGGTTGAAGTGTTGSAGTGTTGSAGTGTTGEAGTGTTGAAGTGTTGAAGTGTTGTAGTGTTGTAGTGTTGTAGTTGSAGRGGTTGAAGTSAAGTSGTAGTTGAAGRGGTTGTAGTTATAGTTGSAGKGGSTGTAGTTGTGGSGTINVSDIVNVCTGLTPADCFDGYYWEATPSGNTMLSGTNYPYGPPAGGCPSGTTWATTGYDNKSFPLIHIKGTTGQQYTLHITVRGVVGTRCYTGGTPASTATGVGTGQNNTWYAGGTQYNDSIWNTMEVHVSPAVTGAPNVYYMNSFQNVSNWCQKEATYETKFDATFPVLGGGTIQLEIHDSNCRTLANCGAAENQSTCDTNASRKIDMSGVSPAPATFTQPRTAQLGGTTYYPQWVWIDVTSVTSP